MIFKIFSLLLLRYKQFIRLIRTVGWGLGLIFIFATLGISIGAINALLSFDSGYSILFSAVLILSVEYYRNDKLFLFSIFPFKSSLRLYIAIEYVLTVLPLVVFQAHLKNYINAVSIIAVVMTVATISPWFLIKNNSFEKRTNNLIPLKYFEMKFFVESSGYFWILFWILGFLCYLHIGVYILWMFFILMTLPEIFKHYESRDMLKWKDNFLNNKVFSYLGLFMIMVSLQTIESLVFHPEMAWLVFYSLFCLITAIFMNIAIKYCGYTPVYSSGAGLNIAGMFTLLMIIPGGAVIALVFSLIKYFKAKSNLYSLYA